MNTKNRCERKCLILRENRKFILQQKNVPKQSFDTLFYDNIIA